MEGFQQFGKTPGKGLVDGAKTAGRSEGTRLEGIVIHNALRLDLFGDTFEPFSLVLRPEE